MWLDVHNPMKLLNELHPLDTFFYNGDLYILTTQKDSAGYRTALDLTTGELLGLPKDTGVVVVETTMSNTADLKHLQDCADL